MVKHTSSNRWYQFPVDKAILIGKEIIATVKTIRYQGKDKFRREMYVRDEPTGRWVVHARLMPDPPQQLWIRWDTRFGRVVDLRDKWARRLFNASSIVWSKLWYRAERAGGRPNLQAQGLTCLNAGEAIMLETGVWFSKRKRPRNEAE